MIIVSCFWLVCDLNCNSILDVDCSRYSNRLAFFMHHFVIWWTNFWFWSQPHWGLTALFSVQPTCISLRHCRKMYGTKLRICCLMIVNSVILVDCLNWKDDLSIMNRIKFQTVHVNLRSNFFAPNFTFNSFDGNNYDFNLLWIHSNEEIHSKYFTLHLAITSFW